jgi:hypothetical protein
MTTHDYEAVRKDIAAQLKKPGYDDGSAGPVFVRLAWYVNTGTVFAFPGRDPGARAEPTQRNG